MGLVRYALRAPHTFYVLAIAILFLGATAYRQMPTDIFPEINIPVVTVIWTYTGLSTREMEQRITTYSEFTLSANVNNIKNMEAQTLNGISIQKIFFQPGVNIDLAISQVVSATNSIRAVMPTGVQPPIVVQFNASSVPVLQVSLTSDLLNEQQLYDYGIFRLRQQIAPVQGVTVLTPSGGKYRQIMVDLDPGKLLAKGLMPLDVANALNAQNLTLPSGTAKIGDTQYNVRLNATPPTIDDLNNIPVKYVNGATILMRDVAQVRDGALVQQNIVRADGKRSVLIPILKNGNASTVDVVRRVRTEALPVARASAPQGMNIQELFDQSVFVRNAVNGVLREGAIAAALTAAMILLFLGSWRSTLVVMISIPLAILSSIIGLYFLGETLNTMTLGGLALAVGILVDDSTVTIENTHRMLEEGRKLPEATLEGAAGIAIPTLVSTLSISCVFTSVIFLDGPPRYLFIPLSMAVVFAMLASYGLSRTLTPISIGLLLAAEHPDDDADGEDRSKERPGWVARTVAWLRDHLPFLRGSKRQGPGGREQRKGFFGRFHDGFENAFGRMREDYGELLALLLSNRVIVPLVMACMLGLGTGMYLFVGRDFFPVVDAGQILIHVRAPPATRIEKTEEIFQAVEAKIREVVPAGQRQMILDNIGLPASNYNLAFADGSAIGVNDGTIQIALNESHRPTVEYERRLRQVLPATFPDVLFYFQPADIVTQILDFGVPSQIDVRVVGQDREKNLEVAKALTRQLAGVPGTADVHLQQEVSAPEFYVQIDRARASQFGLTANAIANNVNVSLGSSKQVAPNFWTDQSNGRPYYLAAQTPEYRVASVNDIGNTPVGASQALNGTPIPAILSNVATISRDATITNANQSNIQSTYDIFASAQDRDLGSITSDIEKVVAQFAPKLSPGNTIRVLGQIDSMNQSFERMGIGLIFAAVFVYLLMVVNYQTFGDPLVVILGLPATLVGILTMLFITGTTLNVPSLMGAIMAVGVASANSILLVTFAREQQLEGLKAFDAAIAAGKTRLRPVLMTAGAMIVGMIPMAIGAPGEEQNASLARAVIGGLLLATPTTLLIVPFLFALLRSGNDGKPARGVFRKDPGDDAA